MLFAIVIALGVMAASTLESEAAFRDKASQIGVEDRYIDKFAGKTSQRRVYSPNHTDEAPLETFCRTCWRSSQGQTKWLGCGGWFSRVIQASRTRQWRPGSWPLQRVARQREQELKLTGLVFTPETIPANHLVDLFVEMGESGILSYIKPEQCCSRAQEINSIKKDLPVSTDSSGLLKLGNKSSEPTCEVKLAWQRRNLAMDLAGIASFEVVEGWTQMLFPSPSSGSASWIRQGVLATVAGL